MARIYWDNFCEIQKSTVSISAGRSCIRRYQCELGQCTNYTNIGHHTECVAHILAEIGRRFGRWIGFWPRQRLCTSNFLFDWFIILNVNELFNLVLVYSFATCSVWVSNWCNEHNINAKTRNVSHIFGAENRCERCAVAFSRATLICRRNG